MLDLCKLILWIKRIAFMNWVDAIITASQEIEISMDHSLDPYFKFVRA